MSDSELSDDPGTPVPSDNELEKSLRREVLQVLKAAEEVTVKRIRTASEKKLGLAADFYKNHETWKSKSKNIIEDQVNNEGEVPSSPDLKKAKASKPSKRNSQDPDIRSRKRQKTDPTESSEELSSPPSDDESEPAAKRKKSLKKSSKKTKAERPKKSPAKKKPEKKSVKSTEEIEPSETEVGGDQNDTSGHKSDSDLSILIDEEPKKKQRKSKDSQNSKTDKAKVSKSKPKEDEDPGQGEIKKLQGWLVKCGVRKVWGKELKPYETPKAKIKHLRAMLSDVGMTGRFSIEKANQIKEARELAADIEAVKEGEERWGMGDQDKEADSARPQRKLVQGRNNYDFLSDDDGEETD